MSTKSPVTFIRRILGQTPQEAYNVVQIETDANNPVSSANPFPVTLDNINLQQNVSLSVKTLFKPNGAHFRNATLNAAVQLTPVDPNADAIMFSVEDQDIRMRLDGVNPTAAIGIPYTAGSLYLFQFAAGTDIRVIETAASAVINYQFGTMQE